MSVIEGRLRETFLVPDATQFATFIQEPKYVVRGLGDEGWLPSMAVFIVKSPNPRNRHIDIVTPGTVELKHFTASENEHKHFVSHKEDPAFVLFSAVLKNHLETLQNLRELIH